MLDFLRDFWGFLRARGKVWMWGILVVMILVGALIALTEGSAVAPFIYTLF